MAGLSAEGVSVVRNGRALLKSVDVSVSPGIFTAVIGPNGAGKSTLVKVLAGDIMPDEGTVWLNGKPLAAVGAEERALQRAVLPQSPELAFSLRAWDVVFLGRHPHRKLLSQENNVRAVEGAMSATDVHRFAARECQTLSGGELHRTHYARTLAQIWPTPAQTQAPFLLLDEPTSSLDLFHQHAILSRALDVTRDGAGVLAVLHDLNLASTYADLIVILAKGAVVAAGPPGEVLTVERIADVWRVACEIVTDTETARPQILTRRSQNSH